MVVMCLICEKIFSKQSNLNIHMRNVHYLKANPVSYDKSVWNYKCLESNCNFSYPQNASLINHLKESHNMSFNFEEMVFWKKYEFEKWKTSVELENKCNYIVARKWSSTKGDVTYYNCNRTKTGKQNCQQRQRLLKSQGSCKLNYACTSYIKLTNDGGQFIVCLQKTHYGHKLDIQHLRISRDDKCMIASKLISGVTKTRILDSTRDKIGESLKRIDLLTHKDVDNIKRSYKIDARDGKRHNNDAISLDLWVQECEEMLPDENPILFYKRQNEVSDVLCETDFCLAVMNKFQEMMLNKFGNNVISIDGTHGLNNYNFELTTVMVIDEFGQGFPIAFMFSNRKDTHIYEVFFESIRQKVGKVNARTFMSDITETFYNAWVRIMGPVTYRLFCSWHVDRAWQTNLSKINNKEKRAEVYKLLKVLQEELCEVEFKTKIVSAVNLMLEDNDTNKFGHYFEKNYMNICEQWAYCFRKSTGINTNMRLESMHKTIKYFYLNRKKIKRLDKGLHTVLKFVRDKSVERVIKLVKGKNTIYHQQIFKRHQSARNCNLLVEMKDETSWEVSNESDKYLVKKLFDSRCCCLTCSECQICIHMYSCTCFDFTSKYKICKHIHYIVMTKIQPQKICQSENFPNQLSDISVEGGDNIVSALAIQTENKKINCNLMNKINEIFVKLQNSNVSELSDSTILEIHMHLNVLNNLVDLPKSSNTDSTFEKEKNEAPNKNIEPQLRFSSTQKKRKCQSNKKKTTKKEKEAISNILCGKPERYISENSNNDHAYFAS